MIVDAGVGMQFVKRMIVVQVNGGSADLYARTFELRQSGPGGAFRGWCRVRSASGRERTPAVTLVKAAAAAGPLLPGTKVYPLW